MDINYLITVRHWIQKGGGTLEAYIKVPLLLPYLDTRLLSNLAALDALEDFVRDSEAGERFLSGVAMGNDNEQR